MFRFGRPLWATLLVGTLLVPASAHADTLILTPADTRLVGTVRYVSRGPKIRWSISPCFTVRATTRCAAPT